MGARTKHEIHRNEDGTVHVTPKFRTAAWAHACFGPKGFEKWAKAEEPDVEEGKPCGCGMQPGAFRKASGQSWADPRYRERVQARLFDAAPERPSKRPSKPAKAPAAETHPKCESVEQMERRAKTPRKRAAKAAKKPARTPARARPAKAAAETPVVRKLLALARAVGAPRK